MTENSQALLSVEQALERVLDAFQELPADETDISEALGRVLAEDVRATNDLPPFANSSMDGYAVRAADVAGAHREAPLKLAVVADIPAGSAPQVEIGPGQAARIMTGAPMPAGADAVVPVEQTDDDFRHGGSGEQLDAPVPAQVAIFQGSKAGDYVRPVGEDVRSGDVVLRKGRVLRPADLGVLAGLGYPQVNVIRQPWVAVLSTGDELLGAAEPLTPGKIRDTNGYTIAALAQQCGARVLRLGIARDRVEDVESHLQRAVEAGVDLILSTAGVSVGAFDVVRSVIEKLGEIGFWRVNMRPGKPLAFGRVDSIPFLGLPGNPVSAMVSFDVFARPAICKMGGRPWQATVHEAEIVEPLRNDGRQSYIRVRLERANGGWLARTTGNQSSGVLTSLVQADGLLIVPAGMTDVPGGARLPVRVFANDAG